MTASQYRSITAMSRNSSSTTMTVLHMLLCMLWTVVFAVVPAATAFVSPISSSTLPNKIIIHTADFDFTSTTLFAMGPIARAKKAMDPQDYERVVQTKMKQEGLSRKQAQDEYNAFLENPSFYYALDKKEEYYKSLGYKDIFEGMIGEAEKEGRGEEVRERIAKFRRTSQIKAYSVLAVFILSFCYAYNLYHEDPSNFLTGLPTREL